LQSEKDKGTYYFWNRWGRVGTAGQSAKKKTTDVDEAIDDYEKKLREKTIKGDYTLIDITYDDDKEEEKDDKPANTLKSKLPAATNSLIELIFDIKMMNDQMKEIGYDAKKMPLGKLAKTSIQKGYQILKEISEAIKAKKGSSVLNDLSSQFFSNIPHDFGFK
jgi:poly [ADP-ribose] polymerase 2/3/4